MSDVMNADELDVQTHFVDNPFIRVRERISKKEKGMGEVELEEEDTKG